MPEKVRSVAVLLYGDMNNGATLGRLRLDADSTGDADVGSCGRASGLYGLRVPGCFLFMSVSWPAKEETVAYVVL